MGVQRTVLDNGMTVLVKERPSGEQAIVQMWVRAGSFNEEQNTGGLAHFLEHMAIDRGSENYPSGELAKVVDRIGGDQNGGTWYDYTTYYVQGDSSQLRIMMELIAEICFRPTFEPAMIAEEEPVIEEEILREENSGWDMVFVRTMAEVFKGNNYSKQVLGSVQSAKALTQETFFAFLRRYYHPNNMVLVVAGDAEAGNALAIAIKVFGGFPFGAIHPTPAPATKIPEKPTLVLEEQKVVSPGQALAMMVFPVPGYGTEDTVAIDLLAEAYGGRYSVFSRTNANSEVIDAIGCYHLELRHAGLFVIQAEARAKKVKSVAKSLEASAKRMLSQLDAADFESARQRLLTKIQFDCETLSGLAEHIGFAECMGSLEFRGRYLEILNRLTPGDLKTVARKYINTGIGTTVIYYNSENKK